MEKKSYTVTIAERRYKVSLAPEDEAIMRRAAKTLNEKLKEIKSRRYDCSLLDNLAIASLLIAIEYEEYREQSKLDDIYQKVRQALDE